MDIRKFRMMIRFQALTAVGSTNAQMESMIPRDLTSRYVGITPPLNIKVKRISPVMNLLKGRYDLLNGYAANEVRVTEIPVPNSTRITLFKKLSVISGVPSTLTYAFTLGFKVIR
jgi:hypothetical protein